MFRIDHPTATPSLPTPAAAGTPGYFASDTIVTRDFLNMVQEELISVVAAGGLSPSKTTRTQVRDALNQMRGRGTLVALTAAATIGNNVETALTWPTPIYDDLGMWAGGAPSRLTVPAGVSRIRVSCQTTWDNQATGDRKMRVVRNGADEGKGLPAMRLPTAGAGDVTVLNAGGGIVPVTSGDYIQLLVFQDWGANLDLRAQNTWLQIEVLR